MQDDGFEEGVEASGVVGSGGVEEGGVASVVLLGEVDLVLEEFEETAPVVFTRAVLSVQEDHTLPPRVHHTVHVTHKAEHLIKLT